MHAFTSGEVQTFVADMLDQVGVDMVVAAVAECCLNKAQASEPSSAPYKNWTAAGDELYRLCYSDRIRRVAPSSSQKAMASVWIL
jgi:hypothetical protein